MASHDFCKPINECSWLLLIVLTLSEEEIIVFILADSVDCSSAADYLKVFL